MKPRKFYVGFPPALVKVTRNGVEYGIGAIPLGGYVRIPGMHRPAARDFDAWIRPALHEEPALASVVQRIRRELDAENFAGVRAELPTLEEVVASAQLSPGAHRSAERALREVDEGTGLDAYWRQPTWKRIAVIAAGPAMNILVAFLLFFVLFATAAPSGNPSTKVAQVEAGTPAAAAGLHAGDRIFAVNGRRVRTFDQASARIRASHGRPIRVTVERDGRHLTLGHRPTIRSGDRYIWGFGVATALRSYPLGTSARKAVGESWGVGGGTAGAYAGLPHPTERAQLSGPVGIVRASAQALRVGWSWYLELLAVISMSLALFNLLPLLPLDGGHILFSLIEAFRRRSVAREVYERVSVAGMLL